MYKVFQVLYATVHMVGNMKFLLFIDYVNAPEKCDNKCPAHFLHKLREEM